ncbi:hypothetical protein AB0N23_01620 [Streptomyces sp. NPDC052644]
MERLRQVQADVDVAAEARDLSTGHADSSTTPRSRIADYRARGLMPDDQHTTINLTAQQKVTSHTDRLFTDGPMRRVLELAAAAQGSAGTRKLDDELRRFIRTVGGKGVTAWLCPLTTVTALLDHVADLCSEGGLDRLPADFRQLLERASEGLDESEYLHTLAGVIRLLAQDPHDDYSELPMAEWEVEIRFPGLAAFGVNWIYEGDYASLRESIQAAISSEHPYCSESLAPLASEAQSALVLFPDGQSMTDGLTKVIGWVSADALRELLTSIDAHMRKAHTSPR